MTGAPFLSGGGGEYNPAMRDRSSRTKRAQATRRPRRADERGRAGPRETSLHLHLMRGNPRICIWVNSLIVSGYCQHRLRAHCILGGASFCIRYLV